MQQHTPQEAPHELSQEELVRRVLYSVMTPTVRLARVFSVPLKETVHWTQVATFHELRKRGWTLQQIAEALDVSVRKASQLSAQLKENFFVPEREHELPRRIEFLLWAEPMSAARIRQVLRDEGGEPIDEAEIVAAIETLEAQERVRLEAQGTTQVYVLSRRASRMYQDRWMTRIDGLNHMLSALTQAILGRFFEADPATFARTVTLHMRPEDTAALERFYQETIWPFLAQLDEVAAEDPEARPVDLGIFWAPRPPPDEGESATSKNP